MFIDMNAVKYLTTLNMNGQLTLADESIPHSIKYTERIYFIESSLGLGLVSCVFNK